MHVKQCSQTHVVPCILHAAYKYRQPPGDALRVARCESGLDPYADNGNGDLGLYQFLGSTWASTPYGGHSVYIARWASLGAMWMWAHGRRGEWECQ